MSGVASLTGVPTIDNTYGAILLGSNFSLILYGFNLHLAYQYMQNFSNDSRFVKTIAWLVLALETTNSAFYMHITYSHLVTYYFDPLQLAYAGWSLDCMPIATGLSIMVSQCFFIRRAYKLGGVQRLVAYFGIMMVIVEFGFCLAATIEAFLTKSFQAYRSVTWLISAAFGIIVLTDGVLTISLIVALRTSRTGFKGTDSVVDLLVLYAVTTGLLTTIVNLVAFFFALILPENLIYVGINIVAGKLYVTSLFAALNSRISIAKHVAHPTVYGAGGTAVHTKSTGTEVTFSVTPPTEDFKSALKASGSSKSAAAHDQSSFHRGEAYEMHDLAGAV